MQTNRSNAGALIGGAILIAFGLLSLAGQVFRNLNWGILWPCIVIGMGILFFVAMVIGGRQAAAFAIPGSVVVGVGLVALFQNLMHHWVFMLYFWTLIITFVGAGIYIMGTYGGDAAQKHAGSRVIRAGVILFIIFGTVFEMIFSSFSNMLLPILLIAVGTYLVLNRVSLLGEKKNESSDSLPPIS